MLEIHPGISCSHLCPRCNRPVAARGFVLAAGRSLGSGRCEGCGRNYLFDLPVGFGILYPYCLDQESGEVFGPEIAAWFGDQLKSAWAARGDGEARLKIERRGERRRLVLCNCLDHLYGHVLFKLFGVKPYLDAKPDAGVAVLVPSCVRHLVPDGVSEVWSVDLPVRELTRWHGGLERELAAAVAALERCWLGWCYPCPNPTVDLSAFARPSPRPELPPGRPLVVFCYRPDRTWGRSPRAQARNLAELARLLRKRHPGAELVLTGCSAAKPAVEGCRDFRAARPDAGREQLWIDLWAAADLAIGVHGSNMLIPSGLAGATINLLPEEHGSNIFQDVLPNARLADPRALLFGMRTIYGNSQLSDVEPERVADVALTVIDGRERFLALERAARCFADPAATAGGVAGTIADLARFRAPPHG